MADSTINVQFTADTENLESGINRINAALGYTAAAARTTENPIAELFGALQSSSDRAVAGLIKGTETWHKAMLSIIQDLEIKFVQLNVNKLINTIETEALGVKATQTAATQKIAANEAANSASTESNAVQVIKQIKSDAAATYAGVYAYLSPVMGPLAAVPAGVSAGAVAAMEGLVSLDVGAWNVPQNMPAYLHAGEMVVPADFASGLRSGGGVGGDNYTISINAIDTQTGAQFLKNNASAIASALSSQVRNFNKNIPAWKS